MRAGTFLRWAALRNILKFQLKDGSAILDIGGYDGYISYKLKRLFPHIRIIVLDIDNSGLQLAKKQDLKTLLASALQLPIADNQLDFVLCLDLIEHLKEDRELIAEISRVLKKDAKLILTTPMENGLSYPFLTKEKQDQVNRNFGHIRKGYSLERLREMFGANNLKIEKTSRYDNLISRFIYWFVHFSPFQLKGAHFLYRIAIQLEPYLKFKAEEHIIIGRKMKQNVKAE